MPPEPEAVMWLLLRSSQTGSVQTSLQETAPPDSFSCMFQMTKIATTYRA